MAANPGLEDAETLWKMLDDLAETSPESYKKFIDKMLKDNKDCLKPPEPVFCMRTLKLPESSNHHIFINICKWDNVASPKGESDRISVVASNLRDIPECTSKHSVIDLCFHSAILTKALVSNINHCSKIMGPMALEYIENREGVKLSRCFKVLTIKYKGDVKDLGNFVFPSGLKNRKTTQPASDNNTADTSILHGLSNIVKQRSNDEFQPSGPAGDIRIGGDSKMASSAAPRKPLIQEVSRVVSKEKCKSPPEYHVEIVEAISGPKCMVVVVELPKVHSGAECELDVSKEDLVLSTPDNAKLSIRLPEKGDEDETTSTFDKSTHQLTVTIPILSK